MKFFLLLIFIFPCLISCSENKPRKEQFLWSAIIRGNRKLVEKHIKEGTDINYKDSQGNNALMYAVMHNHYDLAIYLIKNGADVNTKNSFGNTPFLSGIKDGNKKFIDFLIEDNSVEILPDSIFRTVKFNQLEMLKLLLTKGQKLSIDIKDKNGQTPLILASVLGNKDIVKFLIAKGADKNINDNSNTTAIQYAELLGKNEIVKILSTYEPKPDKNSSDEKEKK